MEIGIAVASVRELQGLHELYRQEANCQLVRDSFWSRGLLDPYVVKVDGRLAGYGAVANRYDKGRFLEFYVFPTFRRHSLRLFRKMLTVTGATHIEAQSNVPLMLLMLNECASEVHAEKVLFREGFTTQLVCPANGMLRQKRVAGELPIFKHQHEPEGDWLIQADQEVVATGGYLSHYNPPFADLYMEVAEPHRRRGFGSYLIQELKRICYENGKTPSARCDRTNLASRTTLEKAGMLACAHLLVGVVSHAEATRSD